VRRSTIREIVLMDEILPFTDEALDFIVDKALEYKLEPVDQSLCEAILTDAMLNHRSEDKICRCRLR
jgi:ATP-dependent Clp protease ATP-binding subunit ClpX